MRTLNSAISLFVVWLCVPLFASDIKAQNIERVEVNSSSIIELIDSSLKSRQPYRVALDVILGDEVVSGYYEVDKSQYYIKIDEQELYGDESVKYEVFNGRKEVIVDYVSPEYSGNLLANPAMAFEAIKSGYSAEITSQNSPAESITIALSPNNTDDSDIKEDIELVVSKSTLLPTAILYTFGDEQVLIRLGEVEKLSSTITLFDLNNYSDYEIIDFR